MLIFCYFSLLFFFLSTRCDFCFRFLFFLLHTAQGGRSAFALFYLFFFFLLFLVN